MKQSALARKPGAGNRGADLAGHQRLPAQKARARTQQAAAEAAAAKAAR